MTTRLILYATCVGCGLHDLSHYGIQRSSFHKVTVNLISPRRGGSSPPMPLDCRQHRVGGSLRGSVSNRILTYTWPCPFCLVRWIEDKRAPRKLSATFGVRARARARARARTRTRIWHNFGIILAQFWNNVGTMVRSFWGNFRIILGQV